ncbi:short-chain dehydrogenase/reductase-like protein [Bimuria novae-zelandiae CBS 107.79]|uniref:Short-chain dehydrogenase/reductase-like protein n=1 Tax=Bimuria novae-zelandiae CBS 107.79 TaxID=1447943 RepID=A0A6A5UU78_9PLEO|nr:short-chain dehydrogenase/reductase-like protein [Bimuria novae-zelandiae CBS 107.79]
MPGRLHNKVAIVTGSASGIGRAIALLFAFEGAAVVITDIQESSRLAAAEGTDGHLTTVQEIEKAGGKAVFVKANIAVASDVEALVEEAVTLFGRLDIMVNNAGTGEDLKKIWEYREEHWDKIININLKGVFLGTKYASRQMVAQKASASGDKGWIVNIASIWGLAGQTNYTGYTAAKHGVIGLTKTAALDCAPHRIHVNALCPGFTNSAMTHHVFSDEALKTRLLERHPFRGLGEGKDIARAALFLSSEDASWVTGVSIPIDGGYSSM